MTTVSNKVKDSFSAALRDPELMVEAIVIGFSGLPEKFYANIQVSINALNKDGALIVQSLDSARIEGAEFNVEIKGIQRFLSSENEFSSK